MAKTKKREKQLRKIRKDRQKKSQSAYLVLPNSSSSDIPHVNMPAMLRGIANRDEKVWDAIIDCLHFFETHHYLQYSRAAIKDINEFVHCVFTAMVTDGFLPRNELIPKLVQCGHIFQHLVSTCSYRDCDAILDATLATEHNLAKILALLNPRGEIQLNQEKLFEANPYLASLWYQAYLMGISSPTKRIQSNLYRHLQQMSEKFEPPHHSVSGLYFGCTYHNPESVRRVKRIINQGLKKKFSFPEIKNNPNPNSIAIATCRWHRNHAVYKSASPLVEQLVGNYKLTLIWTGNPKALPGTMVKEYFDKVVYCYFEPNGKLVIPDEVLDNDFQMVYYPDIGMSDESIWMSNMRIAPIQAVGYGHPDTTGDGNEIDYFIGGQVEKEADDAYSETRVLLPGLAQEPAWPTAERQHNYQDDGVVRINCVWGPDKYNHTLLTMLAEINKQVNNINPDTKHEFHLFGSPGLNRYAALPPFIRDVKTLLPNAHIHSQWEYYDYMREAEKNDFSLNSFPFGCYNVLIESLWMGLPFLTLVGQRFYNRAGMWLNEQIGMEENNFSNPQRLIAKAAELITNPDELKRQRVHLASVDLKDKLFTLRGNHFLEAVEYIIDNHPFTETKLIGEN